VPAGRGLFRKLSTGNLPWWDTATVIAVR
jgi:hypothetical protein